MTTLAIEEASVEAPLGETPGGVTVCFLAKGAACCKSTVATALRTGVESLERGRTIAAVQSGGGSVVTLDGDAPRGGVEERRAACACGCCGRAAAASVERSSDTPLDAGDCERRETGVVTVRGVGGVSERDRSTARGCCNTVQVTVPPFALGLLDAASREDFIRPGERLRSLRKDATASTLALARGLLLDPRTVAPGWLRWSTSKLPHEPPAAARSVLPDDER
mmetsp:Transcript_55063/g.103288  ORF Transcript_55063/g.103288 Transcript_55063/m.103288 type:complete len:223 (+) Transcript_55063:1394-2062(+)